MNPIFHRITGAPDPVAPFHHTVESDGWVFFTGPAKGGRIEIDLVARRSSEPNAT